MTGYDRENTNLNYEDIINLPHPVSKRHKPMPVEDRQHSLRHLQH